MLILARKLRVFIRATPQQDSDFVTVIIIIVGIICHYRYSAFALYSQKDFYQKLQLLIVDISKSGCYTKTVSVSVLG